MGGMFAKAFAGIDSRFAGHCFGGRVKYAVTVPAAERTDGRIQRRYRFANPCRRGDKQPLAAVNGSIRFFDEVGLSLTDCGKREGKRLAFLSQDRFPFADPSGKRQCAFQ